MNRWKIHRNRQMTPEGKDRFLRRTRRSFAAMKEAENADSTKLSSVQFGNGTGIGNSPENSDQTGGNVFPSNDTPDSSIVESVSFGPWSAENEQKTEWGLDDKCPTQSSGFSNS